LYSYETEVEWFKRS
jgi:hypothetical protein